MRFFERFAALSRKIPGRTPERGSGGNGPLGAPVRAAGNPSHSVPGEGVPFAGRVVAHGSTHR
jgi:hypothetical protein